MHGLGVLRTRAANRSSGSDPQERIGGFAVLHERDDARLGLVDPRLGHADVPVLVDERNDLAAVRNGDRSRRDLCPAQVEQGVASAEPHGARSADPGAVQHALRGELAGHERDPVRPHEHEAAPVSDLLVIHRDHRAAGLLRGDRDRPAVPSEAAHDQHGVSEARRRESRKAEAVVDGAQQAHGGLREEGWRAEQRHPERGLRQDRPSGRHAPGVEHEESETLVERDQGGRRRSRRRRHDGQRPHPQRVDQDGEQDANQVGSHRTNRSQAPPRGTIAVDLRPKCYVRAR